MRMVACGVLLWLLSVPLWAAGIEIKEVRIEQREGAYLLDAAIDYDLSESILEALHSGVAMIFEVRLRVLRRGAWFWEYDILDQRLPFQLRYHALASVYELVAPESGQPMRFATRAAALRALGTLSDSKLAPIDHLRPDTPYLLSMEVKLDIESLPVPLRPLAYLSADWSIRSEQRTWPLNP